MLSSTLIAILLFALCNCSQTNRMPLMRQTLFIRKASNERNPSANQTPASSKNTAMQKVVLHLSKYVNCSAQFVEQKESDIFDDFDKKEQLIKPEIDANWTKKDIRETFVRILTGTGIQLQNIQSNPVFRQTLMKSKLVGEDVNMGRLFIELELVHRNPQKLPESIKNVYGKLIDKLEAEIYEAKATFEIGLKNNPAEKAQLEKARNESIKASQAKLIDTVKKSYFAFVKRVITGSNLMDEALLALDFFRIHKAFPQGFVPEYFGYFEATMNTPKSVRINKFSSMITNGFLLYEAICKPQVFHARCQLFDSFQKPVKGESWVQQLNEVNVTRNPLPVHCSFYYLGPYYKSISELPKKEISMAHAIQRKVSKLDENADAKAFFNQLISGKESIEEKQKIEFQSLMSSLSQSSSDEYFELIALIFFHKGSVDLNEIFLSTALISLDENERNPKYCKDIRVGLLELLRKKKLNLSAFNLFLSKLAGSTPLSADYPVDTAEIKISVSEEAALMTAAEFIKCNSEFWINLGSKKPFLGDAVMSYDEFEKAIASKAPSLNNFASNIALLDSASVKLIKMKEIEGLKELISSSSAWLLFDSRELIAVSDLSNNESFKKFWEDESSRNQFCSQLNGADLLKMSSSFPMNSECFLMMKNPFSSTFEFAFDKQVMKDWIKPELFNNASFTVGLDLLLQEKSERAKSICKGLDLLLIKDSLWSLLTVECLKGLECKNSTEKQQKILFRILTETETNKKEFLESFPFVCSLFSSLNDIPDDILRGMNENCYKFLIKSNIWQNLRIEKISFIPSALFKHLDAGSLMSMERPIEFLNSLSAEQIDSCLESAESNQIWTALNNINLSKLNLRDHIQQQRPVPVALEAEIRSFAMKLQSSWMFVLASLLFFTV